MKASLRFQMNSNFSTHTVALLTRFNKETDNYTYDAFAFHIISTQSPVNWPSESLLRFDGDCNVSAV